MAKQKYDLHIESNDFDDDSSLALIRFPAMRSQFENKAEDIQLSIKPKSLQTKLEVDIDSSSENFSQTAAQSLASKSNPKTFPQASVDRNFYSSTRIPIEDGQLFVGRIVNNKIVCRPISNIITMRSDLSHFDPKEEVDPKEEIRPISVKFAAPDRQHTSLRNQDNQLEPDDPLDEYRNFKYSPLDSRKSASQRSVLFGKQVPKVKRESGEDSVDVKPTIPLRPLIPDIKPKVEKKEFDEIYTQQQTSQQLNSPKKSNQVKHWVKNCLLKAKIVSFEEVYRFIRAKQSSSSGKDNFQLNNKDILDALTDLALLVQGIWAVKSELLYGDSSERDCTDVTGISINYFIAARDYLLWLFTQTRVVSRLEFSRQVRMPDYDILDLFNQLATFKSDIKKWELKLPTDNRFLEEFPDVVQRQAALWKVKKANKLSIFEPT